jgi:hypothetical protein
VGIRLVKPLREASASFRCRMLAKDDEAIVLLDEGPCLPASSLGTERGKLGAKEATRQAPCQVL